MRVLLFLCLFLVSDCIQVLKEPEERVLPKHANPPPRFDYGEEFYNSALGNNQTIRVLVPPTNSSASIQYPVIHYLHRYPGNISREQMVETINQTASFFQALLKCLTTTYTCTYYPLDSACAVHCLSYIPEVGGWTNAMYVLERMGISLNSALPFMPPVIVVIADYASSFYTNRRAGNESYFPSQDFTDRGKRLPTGATGKFEDALLEVVSYVDNHYPNAGWDRAIFGHEMGGYGAIKAALRNPSVFLTAAAQSSVLDLSMLLNNFDVVGQDFNENFPSFFDVFGNGTFSSSNVPTNNNSLPRDINLALNVSYVLENDPVSIVEKNGSPIPIYLQIAEKDVENGLIYNGTRNLCEKLAATKSVGKMYKSVAVDWVIDIGYILNWLTRVIANELHHPVFVCE